MWTKRSKSVCLCEVRGPNETSHMLSDAWSCAAAAAAAALCLRASAKLWFISSAARAPQHRQLPATPFKIKLSGCVWGVLTSL